MKKALAIISEKPELAEIFKNLDRDFAPIEERVRFLQKQMNDLISDADATKSKHWDQVEVWARAAGLLSEDYTKEKYTMHYHESAGVLFLETKDEKHKIPENLKDFLTEMFERRCKECITHHDACPACTRGEFPHRNCILR